jgi:hypothetical protein
MLTDEEKLKIELQEQYRQEVTKKFASRSKIDYIETVIKIVQGLAIIIGIWATYAAYRQQNKDRAAQEKERLEQTAKEFRKSFYEKQFQFYCEAAEATSTLATEEIGSEDYTKARKEFYRLYWGRLGIVENMTVEAEMKSFKILLDDYEKQTGKVTQWDMQVASLKLAHEASKYTIDVWLEEDEKANYRR